MAAAGEDGHAAWFRRSRWISWSGISKAGPSDRIDHDQNRRPSLPSCGKHWRRKPTV